MFNSDAVKTFVILAVLSVVAVFVFQQSVSVSKMSAYLQNPSKKPSRVRNHIKLQDANLEQETPIRTEAFRNSDNLNQQSSSSPGPSPPRDVSVQRMSAVPSAVAPSNTSKASAQKKSSDSSSQSSNVRTSGSQPISLPSVSRERSRRLPKALIIGFSKCGTAALRTFLTIHPDVVSPIPELRFFTENFAKGMEWYRRQMPLSTEQQLTIEKTPSYIMTNESLRRIHEYYPSVKLIVIVRDPITRLQSQYAHASAHTKGLPPFKTWWNEKPNDMRILRFCNYARFIRQAFLRFHRRQILVLSEDDMEKNPLPVLREAEKFLGLRPAFTDDMFVYNEEKGFHCFNTHSKLFPRVLKLVQVNKLTGCLGSNKGREHVQIEQDYLKHLQKVIRPLNEDLFNLIGKRFTWDNFRQEL